MLTCCCAVPCPLQDGTCQGEAEQCVAGYSCCSTTPALYCQKNTATQLLGTCETVSSGWSVSRAHRSRQCKQLPASMLGGLSGTWLAQQPPPPHCPAQPPHPGFGITLCSSATALRLLLLPAYPPGLQCVVPDFYGCSAVNACCDTRKCEMANAADTNGQCRTVGRSTPAMVALARTAACADGRAVELQHAWPPSVLAWRLLGCVYDTNNPSGHLFKLKSRCSGLACSAWA